MKKKLALILAAIIATSLFSGCGATNGANSEVLPPPVIVEPLTLEDDMFSIENGTLIACYDPSGEVEVPSGVITIGDNAFKECKSITSVILPEVLLLLETKHLLTAIILKRLLFLKALQL